MCGFGISPCTLRGTSRSSGRRLVSILHNVCCIWTHAEAAPDCCLRLPRVQAQFKGQMVLIGVDDMDLFKGIELKLQALERVLDHHAEWRGRLVLVQVTNPPRRVPSRRHPPAHHIGGACASGWFTACCACIWQGQMQALYLTWQQLLAYQVDRQRLHGADHGQAHVPEPLPMPVSRGSGKDIAELHQYCMELVDGINAKYGDGDYAPVVWLERPVRGGRAHMTPVRQLGDASLHATHVLSQGRSSPHDLLRCWASRVQAWSVLTPW